MRKIAQLISQHRILFAVIIIVAAAACLLGSMYARQPAGTTMLADSLSSKETEITVSNKNYEAGSECLERCDYQNAITYLALALDEESASLGQDSLEIAEIRSELGEAQCELGLYSEAHDNLNSAYVTMRDNLGSEDETTVRTECMLLKADSLSGDVQQSLAWINDAYYNAKGVSLKITIAQSEAWICQETGDFEKAAEWYDILSYWYQFVGFNNPGCVSMLNDYGILETQVGHYDSAKSSFEWAVQYWGEYSEEDDALIASVYLNQAALYIRAGNLTGAQEALSEADSIYRNLYGDENIYSSSVSYQYAALEKAKGNKEGQLEYLKKALAQAESTNAQTVDIEIDLSEYFLEENDTSSALNWANSALSSQKNALLEDSLVAAKAYEQICKSELAANDYSDAKQAAEKCVSIRQKILGKDNPLTGQSYSNLALACAKESDTTNAIWYATLSLDVCERYYTEEQAEYAEITLIAGKALYEAGDNEGAIEALNTSRASRDRMGMSTDEADHFLSLTSKGGSQA